MALAEYIPVAPIHDQAREHNENLPGMGGVFNVVNLHLYHYAGIGQRSDSELQANNPVKYTDPDGRASEAVGYSGSYTGEPTKAVVDTPIATVAILYMLKTLGKEAWTGIKAVAPYALIPLFIFSLQGDSVKSQAQTDNAKAQAQGNLQAISPSPAPNEPDNDKDKQRTSPNQMNQQVKRGKTPKSVDRVDSANTNVRGEQDHIHFKDGNALNKDGSWKEGLGRSLTNVEKQWIIDNNWAVPMD